MPHAPALCSIGLSLVVGFWIVTAGTGNIFEPDQMWFAHFYGAQADAILRGTLNVPCSTLQYEAFVIDGLCYGYFGITPSLLRIPLNFLSPEHRGHWAGLIAISASATFLFSAYGISLLVRRLVEGTTPVSARFGLLSGLFLLLLGLGGTNVFLLSRPIMYHEAILLSCALSTFSLYCVLRYVVDRTDWALAVGGGAALLALHARPLTGLVAVAVFAVAPALRSLRAEAGAAPQSYFVRLAHLWTRPTRWQLLATILFAGLFVASYAAVSNYKFGTVNGVPVMYANNYDDARLENIEGSMFHLENLRWNLNNYFGFEGLETKIGFPYVRLRIPPQTELDRIGRADTQAQFPEAKIDGIESFVSLPVAMPGLLLLSIVGLVACVRERRRLDILLVPILGSLLGPIALLCFVYLTYRYCHEYSMFFVLAGAVGIVHLSRLEDRWRTGVLILGFALTVWGVALNVYFALWYQLHDTNIGLVIPEMNERLGTILQ